VHPFHYVVQMIGNIFDRSLKTSTDTALRSNSLRFGDPIHSKSVRQGATGARGGKTTRTLVSLTFLCAYTSREKWNHRPLAPYTRVRPTHTEGEWRTVHNQYELSFRYLPSFCCWIEGGITPHIQYNPQWGCHKRGCDRIRI
jgi:hypothetical protein